MSNKQRNFHWDPSLSQILIKVVGGVIPMTTNVYSTHCITLHSCCTDFHLIWQSANKITSKWSSLLNSSIWSWVDDKMSRQSINVLIIILSLNSAEMFVGTRCVYVTWLKQLCRYHTLWVIFGMPIGLAKWKVHSGWPIIHYPLPITTNRSKSIFCSRLADQ